MTKKKSQRKAKGAENNLRDWLAYFLLLWPFGALVVYATIAIVEGLMKK